MSRHAEAEHHEVETVDHGPAPAGAGHKAHDEHKADHKPKPQHFACRCGVMPMTPLMICPCMTATWGHPDDKGHKDGGHGDHHEEKPPTFHSQHLPDSFRALFPGIWKRVKAKDTSPGLIHDCRLVLGDMLKELQRLAGMGASTAASSGDGGGYGGLRGASSSSGGGASESGDNMGRIKALIGKGVLLRGAEVRARSAPIDKPKVVTDVTQGQAEAFLNLLWLVAVQGFEQTPWGNPTVNPPKQTESSLGRLVGLVLLAVVVVLGVLWFIGSGGLSGGGQSRPQQTYERPWVSPDD